MKNHIPQRIATLVTLAISAALLLSHAVHAEVFPFRVAFENVPGVEEIEAGNIPAGIQLLENQLNQVDQVNSGDLWATLCAAYIVNVSLNEAASACDKAVQIAPTRTAFNNRGVFRAFTGDLSGARRDFERARPHQFAAYLEELKTKDVGLMALDNFQLVSELSAKHTPAEINSSVAIGTARIESFNE